MRYAGVSTRTARKEGDMSDLDKLSSITKELHARISRLELTQLALIKTMSSNGTLPPSFAQTFKQDVSNYVQVVPDDTFQSNLSKFGDQWTRLFDAITRDSLKE